MKKIIVFLFVMVALQQVYAQKNEVSFSYGVATNRSIGYEMGNAFLGAFTGVMTDNDKFTGAFNLEYMYRLDSRWAVGVDLSYEHSTGDLKADKATVAKIKDGFFTAMAGAKYYYTNGEIFRLYAKVAVGASFTKEKLADVTAKDLKPAENQTEFAYQISPIALEVGKNFCGFLELGYGNQGIAQVGVRVRF